MQFNIVFIATALLASAPVAMAAKIIGYTGVDCTGAVEIFPVSPGKCFALGGGLKKSIGYSDVPGEIQFFVSASCSNGPALVFGGGSGCVTAPAGVNWESVLFT